MSSDILRFGIETFRSGEQLAAGEPSRLFDAMLVERDESLLAEVLTEWAAKGISEDELFELASLMRGRCVRVEPKRRFYIDVVGTGGSKVKTFNVSTAAAFVIAGAGIAVAKHGNRAASSSTGSADVLAQLGVNPSVDQQTAVRCLDEIGICYMFAPNFHRLSPILATVRRGLGFPTIFNLLGPLCNPASAPNQLIGVWNVDMVEVTSSVLMRLGTTRSWVVSGYDGLDEITMDGATRVAEVVPAGIRFFDVRSEDFGVETSKLDSIRVSGASESAETVTRVLNGNEAGCTAENLVLINAAAAIHVASGVVLPDAFAIARESIKTGAAAEKLSRLATMTNKS